MVDETHLFVFGDQGVETHSSILQLYQISRQSLLLSKFLQLSSDVLQHAVSELTLLEKLDCSFHSILDLSKSYDEGRLKNATVPTVLLCIAQMGWLLV